TRTVPPEASTVFRVLPFVKKPSVRLSGDQNGNPAPSVAASGRASNASNARTNNIVVVPRRATNASREPSGEIARDSWPTFPNVRETPFGGATSNRIGGLSEAGVRRKDRLPRID